MKIAPSKVVSVHYTLTEKTADGKQIESTRGGEPLVWLYGVGQMIPDFEKNLAGKTAGDAFAFGIDAANGYGEFDPEALAEVPMEVFAIENGKVPEGLLTIGRVLPMQDNHGHAMQGTIVSVGFDSVKIDFNHPMAGVDLFFTGTVEAVRDAEASELAHGPVHGPGGHHH